MNNMEIPKPGQLFPAAELKDKAAVVAALALAALEAVAVFNDGGYFLPAMTFCVAIGWITLVLLVWVNGTEFRLFYGRMTFAIIILLALFWVWLGASVSWSIAPDLSWVEFNRTGGYVALFFAGLILGRSSSARSLFALLFLFIAAAAAVYTVGAKALPSVIDNYENLGRVTGALGYINGSGLMAAFAFPLAVFCTAEKTVRVPVRLLAGVSGLFLLTALFFTLSRGAIYALIVGLVFYFIFSPFRIRSFVALAIVTVPTVLVASWCVGQSAIMDDDVDRYLRITVAVTLRWYLALAVLGIIGMTLIMIYIDKNITFPERTVRLAGTLLLAVVLTGWVAGSSAYILTREPSFPEWTANTYAEFKSVGGGRGDVGRLFELGSSTKRWQLWEEAIRSWESKPITGWGGQSFPLTHLMLREERVGFVKQPHGLLFQLLSETGLIGLTLLATFISLTIGVSALLIKKLRDPPASSLAAALFSVNIVYLIDTSYDWDWNIFALTMPYFLITGILVGWHDSLARVGKGSPGSG